MYNKFCVEWVLFCLIRWLFEYLFGYDVKIILMFVMYCFRFFKCFLWSFVGILLYVFVRFINMVWSIYVSFVEWFFDYVRIGCLFLGLSWEEGVFLWMVYLWGKVVIL